MGELWVNYKDKYREMGELKDKYKDIGALHIANAFIRKGRQENNHPCIIKLLKITYIAHGTYMAEHNNPLFDERVQAWKYGPVIPLVYFAFKHTKGDPIKSQQYPCWIEEDDFFGTEKGKVVSAVWDKYKDMPPMELVDRTHKEGTPWHDVWERDGGKNNRFVIIPNPKIQDYYMKESK